MGEEEEGRKASSLDIAWKRGLSLGAGKVAHSRR
jgi:hypothetical protein